MPKYTVELWDPRTRAWEALPTKARDLVIATHAVRIAEGEGQRARVRRTDRLAT